MKRGRGWKMTGRGIKREKRVDSFGKAIRSHDGWYGSSPAFSSIEIAVPSTNVFDWSAIRFVSLPSFLHCLFLFLSFFSHRIKFRLLIILCRVLHSVASAEEFCIKDRVDNLRNCCCLMQN